MDDKIIIYTCLTGNYDMHREPSVINEQFRYIYFSPTKITNEFSVWEYRELKDETLDNIELSRLYKIKPHLIFPNNKYCLYIDANMQITDANIYDYLINLASKGAKWVGINHAVRDCIYEEGHAVVISRKAKYFKVKAYLKQQMAIGFPAHFGMTENNIIFRNIQDNVVRSICDQWWNLFVDSKTKRDQLCLPVIFWKNKFQPEYFFGGRRSWNHKGIERYVHSKDIQHSKIQKLLKEIRKWGGYYMNRLLFVLFGPIK